MKFSWAVVLASAVPIQRSVRRASQIRCQSAEVSSLMGWRRIASHPVWHNVDLIRHRNLKRLSPGLREQHSDLPWSGDGPQA